MVPAQIIIDWLHLFVFAMAVGFLLHEVGLISLGHAGMLLCGAYAVGLVLMGENSWVFGLVFVVGLGILLSTTVLRVEADIFAVVTLAFATILHRVSVGAIEWTGGALGLGPVPRTDWIASDLGAITVGGFFAFLVVAIYVAIARMPIGWKLGGIRDNETVTRAQGIPTRRIMFFVVLGTSIVAAIAGVMQALFFGLVTPQMGALDVMLNGLAAAILARPLWKQASPVTTVVGYAIASAILVLVPPLLRQALPETFTVDVVRQAIMGLVLYCLVHPVVQRKWSLV